jgi:hypothetical protein
MNSRFQNNGSKPNLVKKQKNLKISVNEARRKNQHDQNRSSANEILPRLMDDIDILDEPEAEANTSSYDNHSRM